MVSNFNAGFLNLLIFQYTDYILKFGEIHVLCKYPLKKDNHELKTYLEDGDAEKCMLREKCVGLSIEIAQLRGNIERMPKER